MRMTLAISVVIVAVVAGVWVLSGAGVTEAEEARAEQVCLIKVEGMTCSGCEAAVKMAANRVDGVTDVKASYKEGTAEVTCDPAKTTPKTIAKAIAENTGYKTEVAKASSKADSKKRGCC